MYTKDTNALPPPPPPQFGVDSVALLGFEFLSLPSEPRLALQF